VAAGSLSGWGLLMRLNYVPSKLIEGEVLTWPGIILVHLVTTFKSFALVLTESCSAYEVVTRGALVVEEIGPWRVRSWPRCLIF
jgi:hypothetical protein